MDLEIKVAPIFAPLLKPSRYKAAHGGRSSGKSHFFATLAVAKCVQQPGLRYVGIREVQKDLKESAKLLIEDKIRELKVSPLFRVLDDRIVTPGNGLMIFRGMTDFTAESIKSLEGFDIADVEEAQTMSARSLEMLRPTIRKPGSELWFRWNPRNPDDPVNAFFRGIEPPPNSIVVKANYSDNPFLPAESEAERAFDEKHARERYGHIWLGEYEPVAKGAIWDRLTLHQHRRSRDESLPDMKRIVVAIDPAVSSDEGANETGIVVAGAGEDGRGYVLDDVSLVAGPKQWATRAVAAFDHYQADAIVIEVNQGGEMCKQTLRAVRMGVPVMEVRATRGKHVRAEPIAALYSMGRVSHVGTFEKLEDQLCKFTAAGYEGDGSPDRADALVWGLTSLFPAVVQKTKPGYHQAQSESYDPHEVVSQ